MKTRDRLIGIILGVLLGLGIVTAFVFLGSEQTIDAPGVSGNPGGHAHGHKHQNKPKPKPKPKPPPQPKIATVRIVGGAPPPSGPVHLDYPAGDHVRLRVVSDATVNVELVGLDLSGTVQVGQPTLLAFTAKKPGNYSLIVTQSHIAVAAIRIGQPKAP